MTFAPVTSLDSETVFSALTLCTFFLGGVMMMVTGAAANARRTACGIALAILGLCWMGMVFVGDALSLPANGMVMLAAIGLAALTTVMGVADRSRIAGLLVFSLGVNICALYTVYPLLTAGLAPQSPASFIYGLLILAGAAQLPLLLSAPLSTARFTPQGERRMEAAPAYTHELWVGGLLALGMITLLMQMSEEAVSLQGCMMGAFVSVIAAAFAAFYRRSPAALNIGFLALPAGVLAVGLVPAATALDVAVLAALAGLSVSLCRDALVALRIDEPSHATAGLMLPAMLGLLAPGILKLNLLAMQVEWIGALIGTGLLLGFGWRAIAQATVGLALSRSASEEGLDMKYARLGA